VKINVAALSDTHNRHNKLNLKPGDLLIHAGDWSGMGYQGENERFVKWMAKQPYLAKVVIAGNHEKGVEADEATFKQMCKEAGLIYLNDSSVELQFLKGIVYVDQKIPDIETIKVHGSPMTPYFFNWAFNRARNVEQSLIYDYRTQTTMSVPLIKPHWDLIPDDVDILVTHGPPHGILDELVYVDGTPKGEFVGCEELFKRIQVVKPDLHIFGHIHIHGGCEKHKDGVSYYNAAICDELYMPTNKIHYIEYEK
jgi:predicted phosphohydrolase